MNVESLFLRDLIQCWLDIINIVKMECIDSYLNVIHYQLDDKNKRYLQSIINRLDYRM